MALHRFEQLDPTHDGPLSDVDSDAQLRRMLCDKVGACTWWDVRRLAGLASACYNC